MVDVSLGKVLASITVASLKHRSLVITINCIHQVDLRLIYTIIVPD